LIGDFQSDTIRAIRRKENRLMPTRKAFTLIELLIVVAIIAILAAIAVPNFLEAQVRSKVSHEKSNMRTIAVALEAYRTDNTNYPNDIAAYFFHLLGGPPFPPAPGEPLYVLTTPVAYITSVPKMIFVPRGNPDAVNRYWSWGWKWATGSAKGMEWVVSSYGPDLDEDWARYLMPAGGDLAAFYAWGGAAAEIYDPTNGSISNGDIARTGP
jgi:prepilin-type N-terminal cleavage/methylation domain-containing protein